MQYLVAYYAISIIVCCSHIYKRYKKFSNNLEDKILVQLLREKGAVYYYFSIFLLIIGIVIVSPFLLPAILFKKINK